ncbi:MAG: mitochondrial fission ELM1 family protein [Rickettsiales bacterium]|nr:mitochondrial fission ELM1 family protein [Rickettsiales bacterium]
MKIWILKDFKIGSSKQSEFLARSLSNDVVIKNIEYTKYIIIPNIIKPFKMGIDFEESDDVLNDINYPDMIIFSGRRLAGLAIYLKKYIYKKTKKIIKIVSILNPDYSFRYFDFVILPTHDNIKNNKYRNIITFDGSLCVDNLSEKQEDINFWNKQLENHKRPFYAFMIGGNTRKKKYNLEDFTKILKLISNFVKKQNGTLLISTSRRTSNECINLLNDTNINCDYYLYKWGKSSALNPYYAFIALSDVIFLTADSISMIAEITTTGKPVYVYKPDESLENKHIKFCNLLIDKNIVKEVKITDNMNNINVFQFEKPNELEYVKNEILKRIEQ